MFCSECGSEVSKGLRFCNRCGASLATEMQSPQRLLAFIIILSLVVAVVTIAGLLFFLVLGTEMMGRRDATAATYVFLALVFLTVLGVDALMVRQISGLLTVYLQTGDSRNTRASGRGILKASTPELSPPRAAETTSLHTTRDTHEVPADTNQEEPPTRKL